MTILDRIERALLEHKYRYYELGLPTISDQEYDYQEKEYERLCEESSVEPFHGYPVGWSYQHPWAEEIVRSLQEQSP